jgi:phosphoglycerate dehydrogenase-like enzyme
MRIPMNHTIAVLPRESLRSSLFSEAAWQRLLALGTVTANSDRDRDLSVAETTEMVAGATICVTSWGSQNISELVVASAPRLKLLAHAAGSVKPVASNAVWQRGIQVTSAAAAIALGVAETTLGWIIVSAKRGLLANQTTHAGGWLGDMRFPACDLPGQVIGIVGASHVGRNVIRLLRPFPVVVVVYDPYLSDEEAARLGVRKVSLEELLGTADIITFHAPTTPETHHMLNSDNLGLIRDGVTVINTARGSLIDETAFSEHLRTGRIWAVIDVTDPEPPASDHAFRELPNVFLTPHFAGAVGSGRTRIGDYIVAEIERFVAGRPLQFEVREEMLARIG